jgi:hypothetical protein
VKEIYGNLNLNILCLCVTTSCIQLSFELLIIWKLPDAGNSAINCRLPPGCNGCKPTSSSPFLLLLSSKRLASSDELSVPEQKCLLVNRNVIPKHSVTLQVYEKILNWLTHSLVIWWNCINHPTARFFNLQDLQQTTKSPDCFAIALCAQHSLIRLCSYGQIMMSLSWFVLICCVENCFTVLAATYLSLEPG